MRRHTLHCSITSSHGKNKHYANFLTDCKRQNRANAEGSNCHCGKYKIRARCNSCSKNHIYKPRSFKCGKSGPNVFCKPEPETTHTINEFYIVKDCPECVKAQERYPRQGRGSLD